MKHTTAEGLRDAQALFDGDWDADRVATVHLPLRFAEHLLTARGWRDAGEGRGWLTPDGQHYWDTEECLRVALAAEVIDTDPGADDGDGPPREVQEALDTLVEFGMEHARAVDHPEALRSYMAGAVLAQIEDPDYNAAEEAEQHRQGDTIADDRRDDLMADADRSEWAGEGR